MRPVSADCVPTRRGLCSLPRPALRDGTQEPNPPATTQNNELRIDGQGRPPPRVASTSSCRRTFPAPHLGRHPSPRRHTQATTSIVVTRFRKFSCQQNLPAKNDPPEEGQENSLGRKISEPPPARSLRPPDLRQSDSGKFSYQKNLPTSTPQNLGAGKFSWQENFQSSGRTAISLRILEPLRLHLARDARFLPVDHERHARRFPPRRIAPHPALAPPHRRRMLPVDGHKFATVCSFGFILPFAVSMALFRLLPARFRVATVAAAPRRARPADPICTAARISVS